MFRSPGRSVRRSDSAVTLAISPMTSSRTRLSLGPAAWFGALLIGILLALAIPAFAAGAESTEGSTAVADPPAAQTQEPASTAGTTEPPAPEQTAAPADESTPATTPADLFAPAPAAAPTPATQTPPPAATTEPTPTPTPAPAPPPSSGTAPVTPTTPAAEPTLVPVVPITPPLAELLPVVAPLLPELTPTLPTIPDVPRDRPATVPLVPDVVSPATDTVDKSIALPVVAPPPSSRVVDAVPISTLGAPSKPVLITPAATTPDPGGPLAGKTIPGAGFVNPISLEQTGPPTSTPTRRAEGPADFAVAPDSDNPFPVHLEAQGGPAPVGSSLLAVLASYVLPGGGSLPIQSTLFLFVQLAVILAFALAPRPGSGERLVLWGLLRSQAGHRLAVRRPG